MASVLALTRRTLGVLSTGALWLAGFGMLAMTVIVGWQVFARYVLNDTPSWAEPVSLLLMGWFILLGAAVGVRESFHLGLDIAAAGAAAGAQTGCWRRSTCVLILGFGVAMAWYSVAAGDRHLDRDHPGARPAGRLRLHPADHRRRADRAVRRRAAVRTDCRRSTHEAAVDGVQELA